MTYEIAHLQDSKKKYGVSSCSKSKHRPRFKVGKTSTVGGVGSQRPANDSETAIAPTAMSPTRKASCTTVTYVQSVVGSVSEPYEATLADSVDFLVVFLTRSDYGNPFSLF